jgi:TetR/AcrR family transcriptional repressor of lmrAB and yxaGH operons
MPRPKSIDEGEVLLRMRRVFRRYGYDGASLANLAEETGLAKAALYHHFPKGKSSMAEAVLNDVRQWVRVNVLAPLNSDAPPREKFELMTAALCELYEDGSQACLIGLFSTGEALTMFRSQLSNSLMGLTDAIANVLLSAGLPETVAQARAERAVIGVQGSLVLSRVVGATGPFMRVMKGLPSELLEGTAF